MKIIILIEDLDYGGIQSIGCGLAELLSKKYDVNIVHGESQNEGFRPKIKLINVGKIYTNIFGKKIIKISFILKLLINLKRIRPNIIHSMGFTLGIIAGIILFKSIPIVVTSQTRIKRGNPTLNNFLVKNFIDKIILTSEYHRKIFPMNHFKDKINIIPNLVNDNLLPKTYKNFPKKSINIISISRLTRGKRLDKFITIVSKLQSMNLSVNAYIIGTGPAKEKLKKMISKLNVHNITFTGGTKDISRYLYKNSIYIHTSDAEIQPMILLEMNKVKIPVICSDIGGNKSLIKHGYNGLIAKNSKVSNFIDLILKLEKDLKLRFKIIKNGYNFVNENHSESVISKKYQTLYKKFNNV